MKKKELNGLRTKPKSELLEMIQTERKKVADLCFELRAGGKVKNLKEIRIGRKNIARIFTIIRESERSLVKTKKPL